MAVHDLGQNSAAARPAQFGWRLGVFAAAALAILLALFMLWRESAGVVRTPLSVGTTPATVYALPETTDAPLVVIAHGFAGSRQFMEAFSLTLARAGYVAVAFDFQGHARNPVPMSGDVTSVEGTTRLLIEETERVIAAGKALPNTGDGLALVGHSMATDVIVRTALGRQGIDAVAAVSMYSEAVTPSAPANLLMVSGQWEPHLRTFAAEAVALVDPALGEGDTVVAGDVVRRAVVAPLVEHVGVLYSRTTLTEVRDWLDSAFGRTSTGPIVQRGPWVALLLGGLMALAWPVFASLPRRVPDLAPPGGRGLVLAVGVPAVLTPVVLWPIETDVLPVLVADHLALHLAVYGLLQLLILRTMKHPLPKGPLWPALALGAYGVIAFGGALDLFGASFMPHAGRWPIIAAVALGAIPFMLGDAAVTAGGTAPVWQRLLARLGIFVSFAIAVAFDPAGLFFLVLILPVILLFFLIFGTMGGWVGRRAGPLPQGLALGFILAWSIGVSFPLFQA